LSAALAINEQEAQEAGTLSFMARVLIQCTMPHKKPASNEFKRSNGSFKLSMIASSDTGLPYGSIPRLLLAWIATEAVRKKERKILLGDSLSAFIRSLEMIPTGGRWGSITRLKDQVVRLFSATIRCTYDDHAQSSDVGFTVASRWQLWWDTQDPRQLSIFDSSVTLSEEFFREIVDHPVPVDMRVLKALGKSPMALDIYTWLTYRMSYLTTPVTIPWDKLQLQFGADYARTRDFKEYFLKALKSVMIVYPEAHVQEEDGGLLLAHSLPHVRKR
jgi:hypothetical protein